MKAAPSGGPDYDARIRRAKHLASVHPFAAEVLTFYRQIVEFQKHLHGQISSQRGALRSAAPEGQLRTPLDVAALLPHFPEFLSFLERIAPAPVVLVASGLAARKREEWSELLGDFWEFGGKPGVSAAKEPLTEFALRAFLQPCAEFLGARTAEPPLASTYRACPRCGSAPLLGVLRPEGDGGKRRLLCSFCLQEWDFRRIYCAACGEEDEKKLPVYVAEQFPHIRVESCDTCKFYLTTIDLTTDGNAVPMVDDLAAIPLSLWAHERGLTRLHANLLGT